MKQIIKGTLWEDGVDIEYTIPRLLPDGVEPFFSNNGVQAYALGDARNALINCINREARNIGTTLKVSMQGYSFITVVSEHYSGTNSQRIGPRHIDWSLDQMERLMTSYSRNGNRFNPLKFPRFKWAYSNTSHPSSYERGWKYKADNFDKLLNNTLAQFNDSNVLVRAI